MYLASGSSVKTSQFGTLRAGADVLQRLLVDVADAVLAAGFDGHVGQRHAVFERERCDAVAGEVHRAVGRAVDADLADDGEDQILGGQVRRDLRRGR